MYVADMGVWSETFLHIDSRNWLLFAHFVDVVDFWSTFNLTTNGARTHTRYTTDLPHTCFICEVVV